MAAHYRQCHSCGNYFEETNPSSQDEYCSTLCRMEYIRCIICGNYFEKPADFTEDEFICSAECGKKYKTSEKTNLL